MYQGLFQLKSSLHVENFLFTAILSFALLFAHTSACTTEASMDYETVTRTLTFRNSTEQIVPVPIIADDRTENMESFTALLTEPTPSGSAFITTSTANINIIDQQGSFSINN